MYYGLGGYEDQVVDALPERLRLLVVDELSDPGSRAEIVKLLRSRNPVSEITREVQNAIVEAIREPAGLEEYGVGELGGIFKKLKNKIKKKVKKVRKIVKKVTQVKKKVVKKIAKPVKAVAKDVGQGVRRVAKSKAFQYAMAPFTAGQSIAAVRKAEKKVFVKHGHIIIPVAGAVLAPFTGGWSVAAAAAASGALAVYKAKKAAEAAEKAGKAEAASMAAEVQAQEAEVNAQADNIYQGNQEVFLSLGITPDKWAALSLEAKIGIIDALSKGKLPPGYSYASESEAVAAGVVSPQAGAATSPVQYGPAAAAPAPSAPVPQVTDEDVDRFAPGAAEPEKKSSTPWGWIAAAAAIPIALVVANS